MNFKVAFLFLIMSFLPPVAQAQDYSWQLRRSGYCDGVATNPLNPNTVLARFYDSLLVSYNNGLTWSYLGSPGSSFLGAPLLVHVFDTLNIFFSDLNVLKRSSDFGRTWTIVLSASLLVEAVVADPVLPDQLYAAATNGDIFRSTDRGITWEVISNVGFFVCDLVIRPDSTNILFVGTQGSGGGELGKILKSTDAGLIWRIATTTTEFQVSHLAIDFFNPSVAYATTTGGPQQGVWKTTDWGEHWGPGNIYYHGWYVDVDRSSPAIVYMSDDIGSAPLRSTNQGLSWDTLSQGLTSGVSCSNIKAHPMSDKVVWFGAFDPPGEWGVYCWAPVTGVRGDEPSGLQLKTYHLSQNYPNPFNPKTDVRYEVSDVGFVSLVVYDMLGREVATLVNEKKSPGRYNVPWDATGQPSGVYFYRLSVVPQARRDLVPHVGEGEAGEFVQTKKLIVLR